MGDGFLEYAVVLSGFAYGIVTELGYEDIEDSKQGE